MKYLKSFCFVRQEQEFNFFMKIQRTCYDSYYPFQVLSRIGFARIDFEPVTILYGGNGTGKSTALNVIAEKLNLKRDAPYNRSNFFEDYADLCEYETCSVIPKESRIITSDDVFDFMLDMRALNEGIDRKREEVFEEYLDAKYSKFRFRSMEDYDRLKQVNLARRKTQSKYVRENLMDNVRERSNGESAFLYFSERIRENALYLLDEPEAALSPARLLTLMVMLDQLVKKDSQFVIATHSPILMAFPGARIYQLGEAGVTMAEYRETEHYQLTRRFLENPERMLHYLLEG